MTFTFALELDLFLNHDQTRSSSRATSVSSADATEDASLRSYLRLSPSKVVEISEDDQRQKMAEHLLRCLYKAG